MQMYMLCFEILFKFDFKMATTDNTVNTGKKAIKDSPYIFS